MNIDLYGADGNKKGSVNLNPTIFEAKINQDLMHRAIVLRAANRRQPIAHTKTRGEISATTKKLFRQKGTGNARRGAKSTNLLRGGGVTHGPRNNVNYSKQMPKKERRGALFSSLSVKADGKSIFALESFSEKTPKTKTFAALLEKLPKGRKYLFVVPENDFVFMRSAANIPNIKTIMVNYINPSDVLMADQICFLEKSLGKMEKIFLEEN